MIRRGLSQDTYFIANRVPLERQHHLAHFVTSYYLGCLVIVHRNGVMHLKTGFGTKSRMSLLYDINIFLESYAM